MIDSQSTAFCSYCEASSGKLALLAHTPLPLSLLAHPHHRLLRSPDAYPPPQPLWDTKRPRPSVRPSLDGLDGLGGCRGRPHTAHQPPTPILKSHAKRPRLGVPYPNLNFFHMRMGIPMTEKKISMGIPGNFKKFQSEPKYQIFIH